MEHPQHKLDTSFLEEREAATVGRRLGAILLDCGKLSSEDIKSILDYQQKSGLRFGEAAVKLGLAAPTDVQRALSEHFAYPYLLAGGQTRLSKELVAAYEPFSLQTETFRAVRSQLMLRWSDVEVNAKILAITSYGRGEGRSYLAANLAVVFSQLGERTLLIDADLRYPRQHSIFNLPNRVGLSAILMGRADTSIIHSIPSFADLAVLTAGAVPPNPQELLNRPLFSKMLKDLGREFDVIIMDTPAGVRSADVQSIVARSSEVLLMAHKGSSRVDDMKLFKQHLEIAGGNIVGTVLNDF